MFSVFYYIINSNFYYIFIRNNINGYVNLFNKTKFKNIFKYNNLKDYIINPENYNLNIKVFKKRLN